MDVIRGDQGAKLWRLRYLFLVVQVSGCSWDALCFMSTYGYSAAHDLIEDFMFMFPAFDAVLGGEV